MATPQVTPMYPTLPAYQAPQAAATQSGGAFAPYRASMPTTPTDIGAMIANHITSSLAAQGHGLSGGWDSGVANMAAADPQIEAADRAYAENQDAATRIAGINASQQSNAQRTAEMSAANQNQFNQGVYRGQAGLAGRIYGAQIQNRLGLARIGEQTAAAHENAMARLVAPTVAASAMEPGILPHATSALQALTPIVFGSGLPGAKTPAKASSTM